MSAAFRLLRSNSLIWDVAVRRYLYGEADKPNEGAVLEYGQYSFACRDVHLVSNIALSQNG